MACRKEFPSRASCVELLTAGLEESPLPFGLSSIPLRRYSWFASTRGRGAAIPLASGSDLLAHLGGGRYRLFIPDGVFFVMALPGGCASGAATVRPGQGMCGTDNVIFEEAPTTPLETRLAAHLMTVFLGHLFSFRCGRDCGRGNVFRNPVLKRGRGFFPGREGVSLTWDASRQGPSEGH